MKLTIHGPNLNDQSQGTFHVHTSRCRDNNVEIAKNGSVDPTTLDVASLEDVVDVIYPANDFQRKPDDLDTYLAEFHVAPCVKKLPTTRKPEPTPVEPTPEPAAVPTAKRGPLQLPSGVTASKIVLDFVKARASSDVDAGGQGRPFITHTGKLVIHAKWLRDYLAETIDPNVTVSQAVTMLRDLGYADRSVAVVGAATKNLSVWMIDAPRGTGSIERLPAPERKSAKSES